MERKKSRQGTFSITEKTKFYTALCLCNLTVFKLWRVQKLCIYMCFVTYCSFDCDGNEQE